MSNHKSLLNICRNILKSGNSLFGFSISYNINMILLCKYALIHLSVGTSTAGEAASLRPTGSVAQRRWRRTSLSEEETKILLNEFRNHTLLNVC